MTVAEQLRTREDALRNRWVFVDVYPNVNMPSQLHRRFIGHGYEIADCAFNGDGDLVGRGQYALWVKFGENPTLAQCGCANLAEAVPCPHDIARVLGIHA
jgi:hypothetical protein